MRIKYIVILIPMLIGYSCKKFLQEDLQGTYSSQTFYKTQNQANAALTSVYNSLLFNTTDNCLWVFGDVASDDATKGSLPGDQADILYIDQFNTLPSNSMLQKIWQDYYEGINRANIVLYYVPSISMDNNLKARYLGEAKFIRAYMYFNLVNIFGRIPLKLRPPLTQADIQVPKSEVAAIYAQIEKDLNEAAAVLPSSYSGQDVGRVTMGAAFGLLAKAYLYEGKYSNVLQKIQSIDSIGIYGLMPVYRENFQATTQNNKESIFEIHHLRGQNPILGNYMNQYFGPRGDSIYSYGYCFDVPVQNFINEFEVADTVVDPRLDYTVGRPGKKWINGEDFISKWSPTTFLNRKHVQPFSEVPTSFNDGYLSYVYLRYADILLMKAEALNEMGRTPEALIPLNQVRQRARESYLNDNKLVGFGAVPANLLPDITSTDQQTVRIAIRHERRVELGFEFHRFFDLMRYGKAVAEAALAGTGFSYDADRYFPIPILEQDNNHSLNQ